MLWHDRLVTQNIIKDPYIPKMYSVNYDSQTLKFTLDLFSSMIRYLEPLTGDIFKVRFVD